jgi:hypothetical protein
VRAGDAAIQFKAAAGDLMKVVDDLDCYYPQLITVGETVVRLAGNATEYLLVVALRHVIATEVDQATRAIIAHQAPISVKGRWPATQRLPMLGRTRPGTSEPTELRLLDDRTIWLPTPLRLNIAKRHGGRVVDIFQTA